MSWLKSALSGLKSDASDWINGRKAIEYQNDLNRENWQLQNEYNTPSAQMARYKEAGLNPNLIYGQSNTAGAIASAGMPESGAGVLNKIGSIVSAYYGIKDIKAGIANKQAQNSLLNSQADYVKEQVHGQVLENALKKKTLDSLPAGANPNDPGWYRDFKKLGSIYGDRVSSRLGALVGSFGVTAPTLLTPTWTVRVNGKEYSAFSNADAEMILNRERARAWNERLKEQPKVRMRVQKRGTHSREVYKNY